MGGNPLLLDWHGSAMVSRIGWEFVEGFLESIGADYVHHSVKITVKLWSPICDYMRG